MNEWKHIQDSIDKARERNGDYAAGMREERLHWLNILEHVCRDGTDLADFAPATRDTLRRLMQARRDMR